MGLRLAFPGAEIIGVDIQPQPNYPFRFVQQDFFASKALLDWADFIWASPPCQAYTNQGRRGNHPQLIATTREVLKATKKPYVIENVVGAPLLNPVILCGSMFDLGVRRHRKFETNFPVILDRACSHSGREVRAYYGAWGREAFRAKKPGNKDTLRGTLDRAKKDMGIDWMTWPELTQAVPPAYSKYIAEQWGRA